MLEISQYEAMAMLDLQEGEREMLAERLNLLFEGFAKLESADVEGVEPLVSVIDRYNVLREDVAEKIITRDELLANAPEQYDGYFQVPGTLE
ncbi:MAG: Asp-tRNA(Asn)/Glu-tRNA(Gln) amidotransferase subunit GatC [Oscillospiraceae bacterium]|nr:Asp-tRNA(Asn)/Glu-tRNA(Gln) amidotransferase subunit GatC [Oscillospiraceae bacterium]